MKEKQGLIVMKFGGTSVGSAKNIKQVAEIVNQTQKGTRVVVVVSAMSTVTNLLVEAAMKAAQKKTEDMQNNLQKLCTIHTQTIRDLELETPDEEKLRAVIDSILDQIGHLLESIYALGELSKRSLDLISSFGERLSIHLVTAAVMQTGCKGMPIEASQLIITTDDFGNAQPLLEISAKKMKSKINKLVQRGIVPVITGFIGATAEGTITTLGRGGSDYSATILGYGLDASEVWIWTDVDGVMTADPRFVPDAKTLSSLSYNEAAEMSYFGAKVLHPLTILPVSLKGIPVRIKNTFHPDYAGTVISQVKHGDTNGIHAISSIGNLSLITLTGRGMRGTPGIAAKLFTTIAQYNINIILISQASSEQNISLVVTKEESKRTISVIKQAFAGDIQRKLISDINAEENVAIVSIVGEGMRGNPGIAGKAFTALGKQKINVMAIAQGSSELNISFVIKQQDAVAAIQSIHYEFQLADNVKTLSLIHLGLGNVGKKVYEYIMQQKTYIEKQYQVKLKYTAVFTSRNSLYDPKGLNKAEIDTMLIQKTGKIAKELTAETIVKEARTPFLVIDTTASDSTFSVLESALDRGGFVTLANKKPLSMEQKKFDTLQKNGKARLLFETTAGAGLPVIATLKHMLESGDEVVEIQGCLSGTLGYIFSRLEEGYTFSQSVFDAQEKRYTEPDPRDDLSGIDVARKALILARMLGQKLELKDIKLESLYPQAMGKLSIPDFLKKLPALDAQYKRKNDEAKKQGKVLRFIATIKPKECIVGLQAVDKNSNIGSLKGPDNIIVFQTKRYFDNLLVVKGPGAGVEVTAAGVVADILSTVKMI